MLEDRHLLSKVGEGNQVAFRDLYASYHMIVFNLALSYTQSDVDAEEVTQDVFLNIYKYAKSFKANSKVSTWIYRITVNSALNYMKKKNRRFFSALKPLDFDQTDFNDPGVKIEKQEKANILLKEINSLSTNQKTAFILSFIEDLPRQEVANIMQISLKATESLLQRAKKKLRENLEINKLYAND